jgi:hypothetical protein
MSERPPFGPLPRPFRLPVSGQRLWASVLGASVSGQCLGPVSRASVSGQGAPPGPACRPRVGASEKYRLSGKTQSLGKLGQRRFFGLAHLRAPKPHEATFRRGLGGVFGNVMQPSLEARCVARRLAVEQLR